MVDAAKPGDAEVVRAETELCAYVDRRADDLEGKKFENIFKVGRVKAADIGSLKHREMYEGCVSGHIVWKGSPENVKWLEEHLIPYAWENYPARCYNELERAGPSTPEDSDVVYVVEWEPTAARLREIQKFRQARDAAKENDGGSAKEVADYLEQNPGSPRGSVPVKKTGP